MRYMLLQAYGGVELEGCVPMTDWLPEDVRPLSTSSTP